jgi:hypothetical protein
VSRGGNRAGRDRFGFGSDGSGQFDFLEEIGSGQGRVGSESIYMLCFFRSLIDFDWIKDHLISDRVGFGSGRVGRIFWVKSGSAISIAEYRLFLSKKKMFQALPNAIEILLIK